jgi:hypothetical protein
MPPQQLAQLISSLSSDQQNAVLEFIAQLKNSQSPITFRSALDQFTREHPELLRLLAK